MAEEDVEQSGSQEKVSRYNEVVYGFQDGFSIDKFYGNDVAYDYVLADAQEKLGYKMDYDSERAKFYMDRFIEGVRVAFERKGKEHLISKIRLGFTNNNSLASAQIAGRNIDGKDIYAPCVYMDIKALEDMSFFDSDEEYFYYKNEGKEGASRGPTWFAARELGVEEGAHILYMYEHDAIEAQDPRILSWIKYHANDLEFDGLNERIIDTEELLRNERISSQERFSIKGVLASYKRVLQNSHKLRVNRKRSPRRLDLSAYKQVGTF